MKRAFAFVPGFVLCAALAGCGASGVAVDGKVVKGGAAYTLADGESITITLRSEDGATGTANVEKDGNFVAKMPSGEPLKPGKYKVTMLHYPPGSTAATGGWATKGAPGAKGAQGGGPATKDAGETWDVSASSKSFTIDISKYK